MKFECKMCGNCCRNMRGRLGKKISKTGILQNQLYNIFPSSLKTIGIFEWEVSILKKYATKLSIPLKIEPDIILWDQNSRVSIVILWNLDHDDCPFLSEDDKCRIYNERPLVCQAYPLFIRGYVSSQDSRDSEIRLGDCPNVVALPFPNGKLDQRYSTVSDKLIEVYGNMFIGAIRYDGAIGLISNYNEKSRKLGTIRPLLITPNFIPNLLRSTKIGLFEFLILKGVIDQKQFKIEIQAINRFNLKLFEDIKSGHELRY